MHGRLKVRTSAELQAIQKKKDQEKAAIYDDKMQNILRKKFNGEYDDEMLSLTSEVIYMNPDVATVWNMRKERLQNQKKRGIEISEDQIKQELSLTEAGLRINPKSYCAWHHRCWILDNFASHSAWAKELIICTKYLELDDRNFHCWDYRRYIIERHEIELEKELDYSLRKLETNFSNYSAWHYRSKLIPRVHTSFTRQKLFDSNIFRDEISLVENAVYTDPKDQSTWFYHRWLLGFIEQPSAFIQAGYDPDTGKVWGVVHPYHSSMLVQGLDDSPWEHLNGNKCSNIFVKHVDKERHKDLILSIDDKIFDTINLQPPRNFSTPASFNPTLSQREEENLREQLKSYEKLLELEPDAKWTQLAVLLIREKLGENIELSALEKLMEGDIYRKNYYLDLASRYKVESVLRTIEDWEGCLNLKNCKLTALYHSHFFTLFREVDLSKNPLGNDVLEKLDVLLSCEILNLSRCNITNIDKFPKLDRLRILDVSKNEISYNDTIPPALQSCPSLGVIYLTDARTPASMHEVTKQLPKLQIR